MWLQAVLVAWTCFPTYSTTSVLKEQWVTESPMPLSSAPAPPLASETPTAPAANFTFKSPPLLNTTHHPVRNISKKTIPTDESEEYYSMYQDYPDPVNSSGSVLPEPEVNPVISEETVYLPDDSLADTDLHDHDLIDSVMYIYFGGSNRNRGPAGRQVTENASSTTTSTTQPHNVQVENLKNIITFFVLLFVANFLNLQVLIVGAVMALVAQFLTLAGALRRLKTEDSALLVLLNTELALTLSNLLFMLGVQATSDKWTCQTVAIALHYLHLVTASWFCANCLLNYTKISRPGQKPKILIYTAAVWFLPAPVVYVSTLINFKGYEASQYCWMSVENGLLVLFLIPVSFLMIINVVSVIFGMKLAGKWPLEMEPERKSLRVAATLLPLFSIVWFLSVVALDNSKSLVFPLLFVASNAFLNWFVFIWWLPGEAGAWKESEDEYDDDFEEELLYEDQHSIKDDVPEQVYLIGRDSYEPQMEPISTISS